jgi:hypothetical protein
VAHNLPGQALSGPKGELKVVSNPAVGGGGGCTLGKGAAPFIEEVWWA